MIANRPAPTTALFTTSAANVTGCIFNDLEKATSEAEAKAAQLSRGDVDAMQLSGRDRLEYGRAKDAVKQFGVPLDAVAIEYSEAQEAS